MVDTTIIVMELPQEQEEDCLIFIIMDIEIKDMEMEELVTLQDNHNSTVNFCLLCGIRDNTRKYKREKQDNRFT